MIRSTVVGTASALAFGLLSTAALATPTKLTDTQLDVISAGVLATVVADAEALGANSVTRTNAATWAHDGRFISIALGSGKAFARGTDAAQSSVDVSGEGGRVREQTRTVSVETPRGFVSLSWGHVVAIEINRDAIRAVGAALR